MIEKYGEVISGFIQKEVTTLPASKFVLLDFSAESNYHRSKIPAATDWNIYFNILQFDLSYYIPNGLGIAPIPNILKNMTSIEKRAAMLEYERNYNYFTGHAALLKLYTGNETSPTAEASLYTLGTRTYLPLSVPYLSDGTSLSVDDRFKLSAEILFPGAATGISLVFRCFYSGGMNFTLDKGDQSQRVIFP